MPFITTPDTVAPAYRQMIFRNRQTLAEDVEKMRVDVSIYGQPYATFYVVPYDNQGNDWYFEFDVRTVIQEWLPPNASGISMSIFQNMGQGGVLFSTDMIAEYTVEARLGFRNSDGLFQLHTTSETSDTFYSIPATRRHGEDITLDDYLYPEGGVARYLTNSPRDIVIRPDENYNLSFFGQEIDAALIKWYNRDGTTGLCRIQVNDGTPTVRIITLLCGPVNLSMSGSYVYYPFSGGETQLPSDFSNVMKYEITVGVEDIGAPGLFVSRGETFTFRVMPSCEGARVAFMNRFGMCDRYTFMGFQQYEVDEDSTRVDLPVPYETGATTPHHTYFRGPTKVQPYSESLLAIRDTILYDDGQWLREIKSSPEVYLVVNGENHSVLVQSGGQPYDVNNGGQVEFNLSLLLEVDINQRM